MLLVLVLLERLGLSVLNNQVQPQIPRESDGGKLTLFRD